MLRKKKEMANTVIKFILRMLIFALSFYVVSEFVVSCDIDTRVGMGSVLAVIVVVGVILFYNRKNFHRCRCCGVTRFDKAPI